MCERAGGDGAPLPVNGAVGVVIPAAGSGSRLGMRKQFVAVAGSPMLLHTLGPFLEHPDVCSIVVALPPEDVLSPPDWLGRDERLRLVSGGAERGDSVATALEQLPETVGIVAIHDAARPLLTRALLDQALTAVGPDHGAVVGLPLGDTLKEVAEDGSVLETVDRSRFWRAQTPQVFPRRLIVECYARARREGFRATDDAAIVERYGGRVVMIRGEEENLKVTTARDLALAELLLRDRAARKKPAPAEGRE